MASFGSTFSTPEHTATVIFIGWHDDHVDVVGHQAIAPHFRPRFASHRAEQRAVQGVVILTEERLLTTVPALSDVIRNAGKDETRETSQKLSPEPRQCSGCVRTRNLSLPTGKLVSCHRNSVTVIPAFVTRKRIELLPSDVPT